MLNSPIAQVAPPRMALSEIAGNAAFSLYPGAWDSERAIPAVIPDCDIRIYFTLPEW